MSRIWLSSIRISYSNLSESIEIIPEVEEEEIREGSAIDALEEQQEDFTLKEVMELTLLHAQQLFLLRSDFEYFSN